MRKEFELVMFIGWEQDGKYHGLGGEGMDKY